MSVHQIVAIATLAVAVVLFISELIPLWMTALAIPVVLATTGTLASPDQALVGFGNPAVLALAAIFVLGRGMQESGVASLMAQGLQRVGGRSETVLVLSIMIAVAFLSAFNVERGHRRRVPAGRGRPCPTARISTPRA